MLVLSRKTNQEILIGPDVRLVVVGVQGNRVRLGICAPDDVTIRRAEVEFTNDCDDVPGRSLTAQSHRLSFLEN